jgi:hypothetical protein
VEEHQFVEEHHFVEKRHFAEERHFRAGGSTESRNSGRALLFGDAGIRSNLEQHRNADRT